MLLSRGCGQMYVYLILIFDVNFTQYIYIVVHLTALGGFHEYSFSWSEMKEKRINEHLLKRTDFISIPKKECSIIATQAHSMKSKQKQHLYFMFFYSNKNNI